MLGDTLNTPSDAACAVLTSRCCWRKQLVVSVREQLKRFGRDKSLSQHSDGRGLSVLESPRPCRPAS